MPKNPTSKQVRYFAARAHDPNESPGKRRQFRSMLMEASPRRRSRAMSRGSRRSTRG